MISPVKLTSPNDGLLASGRPASSSLGSNPVPYTRPKAYAPIPNQPSHEKLGRRLEMNNAISPFLMQLNRVGLLSSAGDVYRFHHGGHEALIRRLSPQNVQLEFTSSGHGPTSYENHTITRSPFTFDIDPMTNHVRQTGGPQRLSGEEIIAALNTVYMNFEQSLGGLEGFHGNSTGVDRMSFFSSLWATNPSKKQADALADHIRQRYEQAVAGSKDESPPIYFNYQNTIARVNRSLGNPRDLFIVVMEPYQVFTIPARGLDPHDAADGTVMAALHAASEALDNYLQMTPAMRQQSQNDFRARTMAAAREAHLRSH